jgi:hypothetical protein
VRSASCGSGVCGWTWPRRVHVAPDVAEALGDVAGADVLLVRREGASPELPRLLRERGARVEDLAGYAMRVRATDEERARLEAAELDAVAIANPTAAAFLARALAAWGLEAGDVLPGIVGRGGAGHRRRSGTGGLAQGDPDGPAGSGTS